MTYLERLPIGQPIPIPEGGIPDWEVFPFEGDISIKVLEPPVLPEPPRHGEAGAHDCRCSQGENPAVIWSDDNWLVNHMGSAPALPAVVMLKPRAHHDLGNLAPELAAELGPMMMRVEAAVKGLGGIARVHVNRWGDGGAHLHWWFFARPEGMMQLRGACMPLWDDVLPKIPEAEWVENNQKIAAALAAGGGRAHI